MNWDDYRYVLAIHRAGGLNAAALELGVDPSSVFRRLGALEQRMEVRLFDRARSGYRLTAAGEAWAAAAQRMEEETLAVERRVKGGDARVEGTIRLSTDDPFGQFLLPRFLPEFQRLHPGLVVRVATGMQLVDLSKQDTDVVIRATPAPPEHLVGRKTAALAFASYAHKRYLDRAGRGRPLAEYDWLGLDGPLARMPMARWMAQRLPEGALRVRFDQFAALRSALGAGLGCTALPCYSCDGDPALERLPDTHVAPGYHLWVLTHPDLRRNARIRAFMQFFGTRLTAIAAELGGEAPRRRAGG